MTESSDVHSREQPARLSCFGAESTPARVTLILRDASWRTTRGLLALAIGVGLTPVVALVPPHVPWAAASLIGGVLVARNRFREHATLRRIVGTCPRCSAALDQALRKRLERPHTVTCDACGESVLLECDMSV